jgi:hypothetical protein
MAFVSHLGILSAGLYLHSNDASLFDFPSFLLFVKDKSVKHISTLSYTSTEKKYQKESRGAQIGEWIC